MRFQGTIFCVAPGPSVAAMDLSVLRGRRVIGVKRGFKFAPQCEAVISAHARTFYADLEVIAYREAHPAVRFYALRTEREGAGPPGVITLENARETGLCRYPWEVAYGLNSGHIALNLAYHMLAGEPGQRRIVLIGYDMRAVDGRTHADRDAPNKRTAWQLQFHFVPAFDDIAKELQAEGVDVVNVTPGSALPQFRRASLLDVV